MIISPHEVLSVDLYADADFAELINSGDVQDQSSVKSRIGWVVILSEILVSWASKMQSEIALSTMKAEYIALSTGMRELIGTRKLVEEISRRGGIDYLNKSTVSKAWEDD